jgi:phosphatidyl-myo-inositol dimannoside synthase
MIAALFPELLSVGGVQLAGREMAAALAAIAEQNGETYRFLSLNDASLEHEACVGSARFRFRGFGRKKTRFVLSALKTARATARMILAAHPNLAPVAAAMKFANKDAKVVVGTHGIEVWQPLPIFRRRALGSADIVLAPSSDTARKISEIQKVPKASVRILPWALDPDFLALADSAENLPLPAEFPGGRVILTVGRWAANERYKGAELLIEGVANSAADFPELHLVLVGSGDDLPRLKGLAQSTGISNRIYFLTDLSSEGLAACYAQAEIFALPSTGEGFGFVFLEAMAMKKPVIGTTLGGIPDIVEEGQTGFLVDPKAPESFARALRVLLSDANLRARMGHRAGEVARQKFSFSHFQDDLRNILSNVSEN